MTSDAAVGAHHRHGFLQGNSLPQSQRQSDPLLLQESLHCAGDDDDDVDDDGSLVVVLTPYRRRCVLRHVHCSADVALCFCVMMMEGADW